METEWTAARVRGLVAESDPRAYTLVDVRQAIEFEDAHLPGALHVPLGELPFRAHEMPRDRLTVVYCLAGLRGAAAVGILRNAGFDRVVNMAGGIMAWQGQVVEGEALLGWYLFAFADDVDDMIEIAWSMEEGARRFYEAAAARVQELGDDEAAALLRDIAAAEIFHEQALEGLFRRMLGREPSFDRTERPTRAEGGARLDDLLAWTAEKSDPRDVLQLAMALEATAFDRYAQLERHTHDPETRQFLALLSESEREHMQQLTALFEARL